jgi:hypothetical protein
MIKRLTLEIEVLSIDQLVLTEKSQWIWARDITKGWSDWERIRVWREARFGGEQTIWSTDSSDIKYNEYRPMPYTHYIILPAITIA